MVRRIGIIAYQGHGATAALSIDGEIIGATSEERFSRLKDDATLPVTSINSLLKSNQLKIDDIDEIVLAWNPWKSFRFQLWMAMKLFPRNFGFIFRKRRMVGGDSRIIKFLKMITISRRIKKELGRKVKVSFGDHHISHSKSAMMQSGFEEAISVVADGQGESAAITTYHVKNGKHCVLDEIRFPHSLGIFYSSFVQFLSMRSDKDEYKMMGLAAYGTDKLYSRVLKMIDLDRLKLNMKYFKHHLDADVFYSRHFELEFSDCSREDFQFQADLSWAAQRVLTDFMSAYIKSINDNYGQLSKNICFSGGVFQNCEMNRCIRETNLFDNCFFSPISSDLGTAVGASVYYEKNPSLLTELYLGEQFCENTVLSMLEESGLQFKKLTRFGDEVAELLSQGKIVGLFQGRSELGPRALGNRSILADPRELKTRDLLNEKIKNREQYRPFAPAVLFDHQSDYVDGSFADVPMPFMIENVLIKDEKRSIIPAAIHVDGTARIQTVRELDNKRFCEILKSFYTKTGVPVLINTSFNVSEEPIVNSPDHALNTFHKAKLDFLVIDDYIAWDATRNVTFS